MPGINEAQRRLYDLHQIGLELARQRVAWDLVIEVRERLGDAIGVRYATRVREGILADILENSTEQNALRDSGVELSWRVTS